MNVDPRQIPAYEKVTLNTFSKRYCVIIPVLNEGDRLVSQLKKMNYLDVTKQVDIIIADAGSTDGSTDPNLLSALNVNELITVTKKEGLSSQLRAAYHRAIELNYSGVITMDGNNKDNPDAIERICEKLDKGYDFVQASRFVPGGKSINAPLVRHLAIKCIHAPMLSILSGFKWTDTTQGFRGYSANLLHNEDLKIFRDVFKRYELLAYITYRAPIVGLKCIEVPSERAYPEGEIPTKISGFKGNWNLLSTLIRTCIGNYNPK